MSTAATLPGIDEHPHARAVLLPALPPGEASHAYLFHGPAGAGKRAVARAFASALLADGSQDPADAAERVARGTHPDLTWVIPSGASEMLVADIDEPVVAAAARTPFESRRRVFVIEGAETMHDATANRLLKTLEEPPAFVHLILLTSRPGEVLPTVASRCLQVRFEAPSAQRLAERLEAAGVAALTAQACGRLALGDGERAAALALGDGPALREAAERFAVASLHGELAERPWMALLELAKAAGERTASGARGAPPRRARVDRPLGARAARARARRARQAGAAAQLGRARSTWALASSSCGTATPGCCSRARRSWCTPSTGSRSSRRPPRAARRARCTGRSSWSSTRASGSR